MLKGENGWKQIFVRRNTVRLEEKVWQSAPAVLEDRSMQQGHTNDCSSRVKSDQSFTRETISTPEKHPHPPSSKVSSALSKWRVKKINVYHETVKTISKFWKLLNNNCVFHLPKITGKHKNYHTFKSMVATKIPIQQMQHSATWKEAAVFKSTPYQN